MGKMLIRDDEGNVVGVFRLEGDLPNEEEQQALIEFTGRGIPEPTVPNLLTPEESLPPPSVPSVPSGSKASDIRDGELVRGGGALVRGGGRIVRESVSSQKAPPRIPPIGEIEPRGGRLDLVSLENRMNFRRTVEGLPSLVQLIAEGGPSAIGAAGFATAAGIATGLNPFAIVGAGMLGGFIGEFLNQEFGGAPISKFNLGASTFGPLGGPAVGGTLRGIKQVGAAFTRSLPVAKLATSRTVAGNAVDRFESMGATILNKIRPGVDVRPASELYAAAARVKVRIKPILLKDTRDEIAKMIKELDPIRDLDGIEGAIKTLERISETLLNNPKGILLEDLIAARAHIGASIAQVTKNSPKTNVSKRIFRVLNDDLEKISRSPFRKGRQARLAQAAIKRAKLEFAVERLQDKVGQFTQRGVEGIPEGDVMINFKSLSNWLDEVTDPRRIKKFDKNLTDALEDFLPELKESLGELAKLSPLGSPAGPGSIVIRGQAAKAGRALVGGAVGLLGTGGSAAGAAIGGLAFVHAPEVIVGILTTKIGAKFLAAAAKAGAGAIRYRDWLTASEIAFRALGEKGRGKGGVIQDALKDLEDRKPSTPRGGARVRGGGRTGPKPKPKTKPEKTVVKPEGKSSGGVTIPKRTRKRLPADFEVGP